MYLSTPFILQNFNKKILDLIQSYEDMRHFLRQKQTICSEQIFFGYKLLLLLSSIYAPFHCAKFKRNLTMDPEL